MGGRLVLHVTKRARAARHGTRTSQQRRFEAAAADTARCRRRGASANGVGWSAPRVGRADNRAKHAACRDKGSVGGRLVLHVTKRARAARHGTRTSQQRRFEAAAADTARCRRRGASANGVGWSALRVGHADNRAKHAARRDKCSVGGRLVLHVTKRARAARHGTRTSQQRRFEAAAADTARCRRRGASANGVGWSAPRVGHADNRAKHAARREQGLRGRSAGSPRDEARARRAPRDENESATTVRSRSRRHGAVSAQRSLGQRRGVERAASWPRRQPRQARSAQRARALWAVGWFST